MGTKTVDASGGGIGKIVGFGSTVGKVLSGTFTFSAVYGIGGELCDVTEYFQHLLGLIVESKGGYVFSYDPATKKIVAYDPLSSHNHNLDVVEEEVVAIAADVGALANMAAIIQSVVASAAGTPGPKAMVLAGAVPAAGEVAVDLIPAVGNTSLTFAAAEAVTEAKVTYIKAVNAVRVNDPGAGSEVPAGVNLSVLGALRWFAWGS